jgi:uncharacterized protein (DUF427 family)
VTAWFTVVVGDRRAVRGAWQYPALPDHAGLLRDRVAFAWRAMDAFFEEDERIVGHAADAYHRIDIRQSSRQLVVKDGAKLIAETKRPGVLFESGFAPRWYVPSGGRRRERAEPRRGSDLLPLQESVQLLRHRRAPEGGVVLPEGVARGRTHLRPRVLRA